MSVGVRVREPERVPIWVAVGPGLGGVFDDLELYDVDVGSTEHVLKQALNELHNKPSFSALACVTKERKPKKGARLKTWSELDSENFG